jgi:hypothetical protein
MEGRMGVLMGLDFTAGQKFGSHGADDRSTGRVKTADDVVHDRHRDIGEPIPAGFFFYLDAGPIGKISENQHDRLCFPVNVVGLLAVLFLSPRLLILSQDGLDERIALDRPEFPDRNINIHVGYSN